MHNLFIASDVELAKISPMGLRKEVINDTLTPCTIMLVNHLQDRPFRCPLRVLMDSGSRCSVIKRSSLPIGTKPVRFLVQLSVLPAVAKSLKKWPWKTWFFRSLVALCVSTIAFVVTLWIIMIFLMTLFWDATF